MKVQKHHHLDLEQGTEVARYFEGQGGGGYGIAVSPDGRLIAWNDADNESGVVVSSIAVSTIDGSAITLAPTDSVPFYMYWAPSATRLAYLGPGVTGLELGEFIRTGGDTHLYKNHFDQVQEQLSRTPKTLPTMKLNPKITSLSDFTYEDFMLENYDPDPSIKAPIAV